MFYIVTDVYPKLLSQPEIYKKGNRFVKDITDYLFEISKK